MAGDVTLKALLLAGLVLLGIGVERLLNFYLIGGGPSARIRLLIGAFCLVVGTLIAVTSYLKARGRS